jgi:Rrf2 family nitric oxide-sensitive transcriptional repressor
MRRWPISAGGPLVRITRRTNLAMRVVMVCAANAGRLVTKAEIASACNASEAHLAHIVSRLGQLGVVQTVRGRSGGVALAPGGEALTVGWLFRRLEADVPLAECFDPATNTCPFVDACPLRDAIAAAAEAFYARLDAVALGELVREDGALAALLRRAPQETRFCAAPAA